MASIYDFLDYREFLKAAFQERKAKHSWFSHRVFLKEAGVRNSGYLKLVMDGKRSLTGAMLPGFARALKLTEQERAYFEPLVGFNQARGAEEKDRHYRELKRLGALADRKIIGEDSFGLFEHWYIPVIRELVCQNDFKDDCKAISRAVVPNIRPVEVKKTLAFLIEKKMIVPKEGSGYAQTDPALDTSDQVTSLAVRNFNRQMISLARDALDRFGRQERYVRGLTIGISAKTYESIVKDIQDLNDKIVRKVAEDRASDRVYQLNFQLFPLTFARPGASGAPKKSDGENHASS